MFALFMWASLDAEEAVALLGRRSGSLSVTRRRRGCASPGEQPRKKPRRR